MKRMGVAELRDCADRLLWCGGVCCYWGVMGRYGVWIRHRPSCVCLELRKCFGHVAVREVC